MLLRQFKLVTKNALLLNIEVKMTLNNYSVLKGAFLEDLIGKN